MIRYNIILILADWKGRKSCASRELKSLIWHLQYVAKVVRPGRRLICGIIESRTPIIIQYYAQCIFSERTCTGGTYIESSTQTPLLHGAVKCHGKATGSNSHGWTSIPPFASASVAPRELLPVVLTAGTCICMWCHYWTGKTILCHSNSEAVMDVINTGSCEEP